VLICFIVRTSQRGGSFSPVPSVQLFVSEGEKGGRNSRTANNVDSLLGVGGSSFDHAEVARVHILLCYLSLLL